MIHTGTVNLLNGNDTPRVRSSEGCTVLDCGCAHTDVRWLQMCDAHHTEWRATHMAALAAHPTSQEPQS